MTATAPLVVGLWLDGTPSRWEPLAAVALGDEGRTRMLLDEQAAADLLVVGEHPTTAAVAPEVLARLQDFTLAHVEDADLVVLGGYRGPDSVKNPYLHGELHGVVRLALHQAGIPAAVVRPAMLFRYAGGSAYDQHKARAAADEAFGAGGCRDAEAWSLWLRAMGLDHLGAPVVGRTGRQRGALREVDWPAAALEGGGR